MSKLDCQGPNDFYDITETNGFDPDDRMDYHAYLDQQAEYEYEESMRWVELEQWENNRD